MSVANVLDGIERGCREKGWDSYGADPVTPMALHVARLLAASLDASPMNDGGVQLSMGSESIAVEIGADGRVQAMSVDVAECTRWLLALDTLEGET